MKRVKSSEEDLYNKLSDREREVFQMIAEGRSTREISDTLCVSMSTVKTHRANIMNKLETENLSQLIQIAIELGIVECRGSEDEVEARGCSLEPQLDRFQLQNHLSDYGIRILYPLYSRPHCRTR